MCYSVHGCTARPESPPTSVFVSGPARDSGRRSLLAAGSGGKRPSRTYTKSSVLTKDSMEDRALCVVSKEGQKAGYRLVEAALDSGAEESVAHPRVFPGPVVPSAMSRAGGRYRVADGHRVLSIGQQKVRFRTDEHLACGVLCRTAEIERPLISASRWTHHK